MTITARYDVRNTLVLVLLTACTGGAADAPDVETSVRDSAGITVVENSGTGWAPQQGWRVAAEPAVDIGVLEGAPEYQLFRVRGSAVLSDGRIVVANAGTRELRYYSPAGEHLRSVGRQGSGPGEFEELGGVWLMGGDSAVTYDWRGSRLSVFDPQGGFVRSIRLETGEGMSFPQPVGLTEDRKLIANGGVVFFSGSANPGVNRDSTAVLVYDLDGALRDTLGVFPGDEAYVKTDGRSMSVRTLAFGKTLESAVHGEHLYAGVTDRHEVGVWRTDGTLARLIRRVHDPMAVAPEDIRAYKEAQLALVEEQPEGTRARSREMLEEMPYPETFPAFETFEVDAERHLWVREQTRPGDDRSLWMVFDEEGRMLGQVELPEGLAVHAIGPDWVLGRWTDEYEVEHVRLHRLDRSPPAPER